jgi:hypothetical protein
VQLRHHTTATITADGSACPVWAYAASKAMLDILGAAHHTRAVELYYLAKWTMRSRAGVIASSSYEVPTSAVAASVQPGTGHLSLDPRIDS